MNQVDFKSEPQIGTLLHLDEQVYELIVVEPHLRQDGTPSTLLTWLTVCPVCDEPFEVQSGLVAQALNRRCGAHRKTGKPVKGKRGRKVRIAVVHP